MLPGLEITTLPQLLLEHLDLSDLKDLPWPELATAFCATVLPLTIPAGNQNRMKPGPQKYFTEVQE